VYFLSTLVALLSGAYAYINTACSVNPTKFVRYLVYGISNAEISYPKFLLLTAILLHQSNQDGTLSIAVGIFCEVNGILGIVGKCRKVTTASCCGPPPASIDDKRVPISNYVDKKQRRNGKDI